MGDYEIPGPEPTTGRWRFTAPVTREGAWYVARCLEVEVASQGPSIEEALVNLRDALELYFDDTPLPEAAR